MKRIQELRLKNFKAFHDKLFNFEGKHALVYGNNGSGKSSIFWALYTFLQSTGKAKEDITKYFVPLVEGVEQTYQSLRHVFADADAEAFIELTWADEPTTTRTIQRIGLEAVGGTDKVTGQPLSALDRTRTDPANGTDFTIREANLGSDFIHYRFLQDFYQRSNREEVNLWAVFMRDLFPFYQTTLFRDNLGQPERIELVLRELLKKAHGRARWHKDPRKDFEELIKNANQAIAEFVANIRNNANTFLRDHFLSGEETLQIELAYNGQLYFDLLCAAPKTAIDREWRTDTNDELSVVLSVKVKRVGQPEVHHYRPQSFLNEAQLTRVALAVRLGALLLRAQDSELKLLCLDDLLISLDMGNRKHVLDWLFGENGKYCREFQIICFTHDRELYRVLRHYITKPEAGAWNVFELVNNERFPTPQPSLLDGGSNNYVTQAWRRFHALDFPACANLLRKETERLLKVILSPADRYHPLSNDCEPIPMPLGSQIENLENVFAKAGKAIGVLGDLALFKQILLNPLSHDSFSTTVYQSELYTMMDETIPALQKMGRRAAVPLKEKGETTLKLVDKDGQGNEYTYTLQLHENLWLYTFPDGGTAYSHPKCQVMERVDTSGKKEIYTLEQGKCKDLLNAYDRIRFTLDKIKPPVQARPLYEVIDLTA
ncbi:hypothetical protein GCM10022409_16950 [Hymenobacter glaciei]|uniref:Rad50/SbcC-type AAA domain-containing protein n=1 Tax=Hymenobacter glaciei TaxID=877209 RepID=A0ABP7U0S5_9BACT